MIALDEVWTSDLLALPESGMGFQFVEFVTDDAQRQSGIAFNAEFLIGAQESRTTLGDAERIRFAQLERSARRPRTLVREIHLLSPDRWADLGLQVKEAHSPYLTHGRPAKDAQIEFTEPQERFFRFSAFRHDKRINGDLSLRPGTYASTFKDATNVRTGADAVRRYALPNPDPAVHRFLLQPPLPAAIQRGIAEPAHGQPGGGVEVVFPRGTAARTVLSESKIPAS